MTGSGDANDVEAVDAAASSSAAKVSYISGYLVTASILLSFFQQREVIISLATKEV